MLKRINPMKNLSFIISAAALFSSPALAATCDNFPTCEQMGYTETKGTCVGKYTVCPSDSNKVTCIDGPSVGALKYSYQTADHKGWLLCNGKSVSKDTYAKLFTVIGTDFGGSGNNFNLPDYRGYFLRGLGTASNLSSYGGSANSETKTPQRQELPNITGTMTLDTHAGGSGKITGAFSVDTTQHGKWSGDDKGGARGVQFSAAGSSSVYQGAGNVIPANYALNVFIYAGK